MSGISRTALEIFTNPKDLEITIGRKNEGEEFSVGIFRGPGHNFKPMITSTPFADTPEEAVDAIKKILQTVHENMKRELENRESLTSEILNPTGEEIDQSKILTPAIIDRILADLRESQIASTYKYDICKQPAPEVGPDFTDVMKHAQNPETGIIDLQKIDELEGRFGSNGGRGCDVRRGPCSCGAWH